MTVYSDRDIKKFASRHINPFNENQVQPASYDVTLGNEFRTLEDSGLYSTINPLIRMPGLTETEILAPDASWYLRPKDFVLGITVERFSIPSHLVARLEGKSSLGRIGLVVHSTAGWIDPGFNGCITLELANLTNKTIELTPGMKIGQVCFMTLHTSAERPYGSLGLGSKYQGNDRPTESLMYLENPTNPTHPTDVGRTDAEPLHTPIQAQDDAESTENANAEDKLSDLAGS